MKLTPMSGAGRTKGDAKSADGAYVEIKDANRTFTLSAEKLLKSWKESVRQGDEACEWLIIFRDPPMTVRMTVEKGML